jgi:hypothetical protein
MPHFGIPRRASDKQVNKGTQVNWRRGLFRVAAFVRRMDSGVDRLFGP